MNHDKVNKATDFLSAKMISSIMNAKGEDGFPFRIQKIFPSAFKIPIDQYYYGKGERTLYLLSHLNVDENKKMWVSIGCNNPFSLKINNKIVHIQEKVERAWPGNSVVLFPFKKGNNLLVIKIDCVIDTNDIEIGFKDFTGKHPHQEQWSLLVPKV